MTLRFVSAGAAHGIVATIARAEGVQVEGSFGAVGAMLEKFLAGEACDIVILTRAQIADLAARRAVILESCADLGAVATSIAVREADPAPAIRDAATLRAAFLAADAIYFPDPAKATAGKHLAKVLDKLGMRVSAAGRLRSFSNGATAMREMAGAGGHPIGCTQATEILATPGVRLVAPLPPGLDLDTVYTAAVATRSGRREAAARFVAQLTGEGARSARTAAGFQIA